jgi:hypothetical protein
VLPGSAPQLRPHPHLTPARVHRCTSLEALQVTAAAPPWLDHTCYPYYYDHEYYNTPFPALFQAHFQGQGSTPSERRSHMQRQLAQMSFSPDTFLAPSSWPSGSCLTSLTAAHIRHPCSHTAHLAAAMQTTSLRSVSVYLEAPHRRTTLQNLGALTALTRLAINDDLREDDPDNTPRSDPAGPLPDIASLRNLQQLHIRHIRESASDSLYIPHTWSLLTALTKYRLGSLPALSTGHLSSLPALRDLGLRVPPWSWSEPGYWPGLARLSCLASLELVEVDVDPQLCRWVGRPMPETATLV